jgi:hypothetical protein
LIPHLCAKYAVLSHHRPSCRPQTCAQPVTQPNPGPTRALTDAAARPVTWCVFHSRLVPPLASTDRTRSGAAKRHRWAALSSPSPIDIRATRWLVRAILRGAMGAEDAWPRSLRMIRCQGQCV